MTTAMLLGLAAAPVAAVMVLALDRVSQWCAKRFWGRLDASSRLLTLVCANIMMLGVGVTAGGLPLTRAAVFGVTAGVVVGVFVTTLQMIGIARDRRQYGRYVPRHR